MKPLILIRKDDIDIAEALDESNLTSLEYKQHLYRMSTIDIVISYAVYSTVLLLKIPRYPQKEYHP